MAAHLLLLLLAPALLLAGAPHPHATAATTVAGDLLGPAPGTTSVVGPNAASEATSVVGPNAAAETNGVDSTAASRELNRLATLLALFCRHGDMPTASCCELVVAFVDHGGGGGAYLSHVSTQPQLLLAGLDADRIIALYAACGRARLVADYKAAEPAHSKAAEPNAEQGAYPPPPASVMSSQRPLMQPSSVGAIDQVAGGCDSFKLATGVVTKCGQTRLLTRGCCRAILLAVDSGPDCRCQVVAQFIFSSSTLSLPFLWNSYKDCHGHSQEIPKNKDTCDTAPAPPPASPPPPAPASPPPPPASPLSPPSATPEAHRVLSRAAVVGIGCAIGVALIGVIAATVALVRNLRKSAATASVADQPRLSVPTAPPTATPSESTLRVAAAPPAMPSAAASSVADQPRLPVRTAPPATPSATTAVADQLPQPVPSAPLITEEIRKELCLAD